MLDLQALASSVLESIHSFPKDKILAALQEAYASGYDEGYNKGQAAGWRRAARGSCFEPYITEG